MVMGFVIGVDTHVATHSAAAVDAGTGGVLDEIVVDLDRPKRAQRRNGAKSEHFDAIRAAREALSRPRLGNHRSVAQLPLATAA